jgi:hypothetical protein
MMDGGGIAQIRMAVGSTDRHIMDAVFLGLIHRQNPFR